MFWLGKFSISVNEIGNEIPSKIRSYWKRSFRRGDFFIVLKCKRKMMQYKKYLRFFPLTLTSWCRPVMDFMSKSLKLKTIYYTSKGIRRTVSILSQLSYPYRSSFFNSSSTFWQHSILNVVGVSKYWKTSLMRTHHSVRGQFRKN